MGQYQFCLRKTLRNAGIVALVLGAMQPAWGQSVPVTLRWQANPERDIAGYRLYYGTEPRVYTQRIDVGNAVTATVSNLPGGIVYFFAVTAYNTAGFESFFSNGVSYAAPASTPPSFSSPTPIPTATPVPTPTPIPTATPVPTLTPIPTATPVPTPTPIPTPTPVPTPTPIPTATPVPTPTPIPTATPGISVSPPTINFVAVAGGSVPAPQSIQVTTSSGRAWSSFDTSPWFNAVPTSGPSGTSTVLTPHTEGLVAGTYSQEITFSAPGLADKVVVVTLTVTATSIVRDDFDRADGELGPKWTIDPTWGSGLSISGKKVVATNSGVHYWNANTFGADQYSQIRLTGAVGNWSGIIVRGNPRPAPFYLVRVNAAGADLYSSSNGIFTQLIHDATSWASGDVLRLEVRTVSQTTAHLTVYRNGAELFSYDAAASFIAGGRPGIGLHNDTVSMSLDDWEGGELAEGQ